jgi:hypothetical protein
MTMPHERTCALVLAGEFLREIAFLDTKSFSPDDIKDRAKHIFRHYPSHSEIQQLARRDEKNLANGYCLLNTTEFENMSHNE